MTNKRLDSLLTPQRGERSSPARSEGPCPGSAGSSTGLSSYIQGSPWHTKACWWGSPGGKKDRYFSLAVGLSLEYLTPLNHLGGGFGLD